MKTLVIYKSKTGFTKKYAEIIGQNTGCDVLEFDKITPATMSDYDTIVYGGGLYAGGINGLKEAKALFQKSTAKNLICFATGGTPNIDSKAIDTVWTANLSEEEMDTIPHFYMQGGICYEKMSFGNKLIMKMMGSMLDKKNAESGGDFQHSIKQSYDISDAKYAKPLVDLLKDLSSNI